MGFLQPLALLGLTAIAIPPLLHLLGRRVPPTVIFPAVRYLTATEREHSRKLRLRHLLLMLLRMVIIALIVLALARPVAIVAGGDGHAPTAVALIVDNSLSSGALGGDGSVLARLLDRARWVLEAMVPADELWLVLADGQPRRTGRIAALETLDTLTATALRLDLSAAIRRAAGALEGSALGPREVVVVGDLQGTAFSAGEPVEVPMLLWRPGFVPTNRSVDSAFAEPNVWMPHGEVIAGVSGAGEDPIAVTLTVEGRVVARAVARPGDRVALRGTLSGSGWRVATVDLDPDELRGDDRRWLALHAGEPAAVVTRASAGAFVSEAVGVLREGGRVVAGSDVELGDRLGAGVTILFPPADPSVVGALNRTLAARGIGWRFGDLRTGEWELDGDIGVIAGVPVFRRYRLLGEGVPVMRAAGEPWLVRDGDVILVGSRMEESWTALPVSAGFVPFLDLLINRVAVGESWVVRARPGDAVELPAAATAIEADDGARPTPADRRVQAGHATGVRFLLGVAGDTVGVVEVNHDSRESDLTPITRPALRAALGDRARVLGDHAFEREIFGGAHRAELTGPLILAAIVAAVIELALATAGSRTKRH